MASRLKLQEILEDILGSKNVYFQPPSTVRLQYPCIIYQLDDLPTQHANNAPYMLTHSYMLTLVNTSAGMGLAEKLAMLPRINHSRRYTKDNLYHDVYQIIF